MAKKSQSNFRNSAAELIKFTFFILMIPLIAAVTISFQKELSGLKTVYHHSFEWGVFSYAVLYFFLCDLVWLYKFGQSVSSEILRFWNPLSKVMPYIFPIYTVLTVGAYYVVVRVLGMGPNQGWWFFIMGFTFAMHLIMTARELYQEDNSLYKPNYLFEMTLVYVLDIFLMVQLLNATAWKFSLVSFAQTVFDLTHDFYTIIYLKFF